MGIENRKSSPLDSLNQFEDELWVELIEKSPESVNSICLMLSLDVQLEKERLNNKNIKKS